MLVTIKNLHEESFTIETEPWEIVGNLKEQIERIKGPAYAAKDIKLLYAGKFLRDNRRLCDYSIDEKTFIIILLKTPKNEPVEEEMEIPTTPASPRLSPERVVGASDNTIDRTEYVQTFVQYQILVQRITELGFTRAQAEAALNCSNNDPDTAVNYLIRECLPRPSASFQEACVSRFLSGPSSCASGPSSSRRSSSAEIPDERLYAIFTETIRDCRARTRMQDFVIDQNAALITQSYEEMEAAQREAMQNNPHAATLPANALHEGPILEPGQYFNERDGFTGTLRDCDHEAIERLTQLGFPSFKVIEAYFLCNRNENAAAEYLIDQHFRY